jgi:hypothetical protein
LSGGIGSPNIPIAVTAYTPFYASTWSYGVRAGASSAAAAAIADVDGDMQNDLLMGGNLMNGDGQIIDYVPGYPIEQGASPTHTIASIPYLFEMSTADFDGDGHVDLAVLVPAVRTLPDPRVHRRKHGPAGHGGRRLQPRRQAGPGDRR